MPMQLLEPVLLQPQHLEVNSAAACSPPPNSLLAAEISGGEKGGEAAAILIPWIPELYYCRQLRSCGEVK